MSGLRSLLLAAAAAGAVAAVVVFWRHGPQGDAGLQHWLAVHTGTDNEPGGYYGFFSGFGSDLTEVTLLGAVLGMWHKHQCHTQGCWRIGKHQVDGTPWCSKHHAQARQTASAVADVTPPFASIEKQLGKLSDDVAGLAEAVRVSARPAPMPSPDGPWSEARKVVDRGRPA